MSFLNKDNAINSNIRDCSLGTRCVNGASCTGEHNTVCSFILYFNSLELCVHFNTGFTRLVGKILDMTIATLFCSWQGRRAAFLKEYSLSCRVGT